MKKIALGALFFCLLLHANGQGDYERQIEFFAKEISKKIPPREFKVAVIDFRTSDDDITRLTKLLADDISLELAMQTDSSSKFHIVERQKLASIARDIRASDRRSEAVIMRELSKKVIADIIITGTVMPFGDNYRVTIKIVDKDGNLISATKGLISMTEALKRLNDPTDQTSSMSSGSPSPSQYPNSAPAPVPCNGTTGRVTITNGSNRRLIFYIAQYSIDLGNTGSYENITISGGQTDSFVGLNPGIYYICGANSLNDRSCLIRKTVQVDVCGNAPIKISNDDVR